MLNFKEMNLKNLKIKSFRINKLNYRGEIGVILINLSSEPVTIEPGDRIAQLVLAKVSKVSEFENIEFFENETERGEGGYGHTGIK